MSLQDAMRRALENHDVEACRQLWIAIAPHLPQPQNETDAYITMHHACTRTESIRFRSRAYSHRWLIDNGYPSGLPDELKPKAERLYPKIVDAVGIACGVSSSFMKPIVPIIRGAMENVVLDHYADGINDPKIIKPRMMDARRQAIKKLLG